MASVAEFLCLTCGVEMAKCLQRLGSPRCHDCRDAGEPISFELAPRARETAVRAAQHAAVRPAA